MKVTLSLELNHEVYFGSCCCWADQHPHFNNVVTSRAEGIHGLLNECLKRSTLDLFEAWRAIKLAGAGADAGGRGMMIVACHAHVLVVGTVESTGGSKTLASFELCA